jgi:hypothetical protein
MEQVSAKSVSEWRKRFFRGNCIFAVTVMYRRSLHDFIGYFDESLINMGDLDFYVRVNNNAGIAVVEKVLSRDSVSDNRHPILFETAKANLAEIRRRYY